MPVSSYPPVAGLSGAGSARSAGRSGSAPALGSLSPAASIPSAMRRRQAVANFSKAAMTG